MNDNVRIAMELVRLAKEIAANNDNDKKKALEKKFADFKLGGNTADECLKNAKEWAELCAEWKNEYPDEVPPRPGEVII